MDLLDLGFNLLIGVVVGGIIFWNVFNVWQKIKAKKKEELEGDDDDLPRI